MQACLSSQPTATPMNIAALTMLGMYVVLLLAIRPFGELEDMVRAHMHTPYKSKGAVHRHHRFALFACLPQLVVQTLNFISIYAVGLNEYLTRCPCGRLPPSVRRQTMLACRSYHWHYVGPAKQLSVATLSERSRVSEAINDCAEIA